MKRKTCRKAAGIILVLAVTGTLMHLYKEASAEKARQQEIAKEIIRLHVVANSDDEEDQNLKLQVKESIVAYMRDVMREADTVSEARGQILKHLPEIEKLSKAAMEEAGFDYDVEATLGECYFPVKQYGDLIFPAGEYEALKVNIGSSEGKNWWCVLYPTLCFVDSTYQVVPDSSKEKLKESLTKEEYDSLLDGEAEYSSWVFEWLHDIWN